jgi:hypothetical protein
MWLSLSQKNIAAVPYGARATYSDPKERRAVDGDGASLQLRAPFSLWGRPIKIIPFQIVMHVLHEAVCIRQTVCCFFGSLQGHVKSPLGILDTQRTGLNQLHNK